MRVSRQFEKRSIVKWGDGLGVNVFPAGTYYIASTRAGGGKYPVSGGSYSAQRAVVAMRRAYVRRKWIGGRW